MVKTKRDYFHRVKRHSGDEEYKLQCDIIELFKLILKKSVLFTAFPAGGGGKVRGAKLKKMGLVAGWPDIQILADGKYFGVEVKTPTGRISPAQRTLHSKLADVGCEVAIVRNLEQAMDAVHEWKLTRRNRHRARPEPLEGCSPPSTP